MFTDFCFTDRCTQSATPPPATGSAPVSNNSRCINSAGIVYHQNEVLYIIRFARSGISSSRQILMHTKRCDEIQHGNAVLMICTLARDDIPSLSAWIKKPRSEERGFLAPLVGLEPTTCGLTVGVVSKSIVFLHIESICFSVFYVSFPNFSLYVVLGCSAICDPKVTQKNPSHSDAEPWRIFLFF